jgi:hypothetical protein
MAACSCGRKNTLFQSVSSSYSGIHFINRVEENDTFNVLEYMNIYTGAGVASGDINNDGLTDLYFSSNRNGGRLYLNKGNLKFEDISDKAGFVHDRWETGVSMVDINQDGWLDIYVNVAGSEKFGNLANLLYINNHDGTFTESAEKYGIADTRLTMNASFFDYDKDGDLDLFLITNPADERVSGINNITERQLNGESKGTDILYRNNGNETFTDVSKDAGILVEGYSLGAAISDLNGDSWPDIYVSNDFLTNDILYINNRDGTFTDRTGEYLKHTSFASMGNDVADFNNDARPDIFVLDMLPEDNYRRKMIIPAVSYDKFQLSLQKGYEPQYTRNTLQLNNGNGSFSEIAFLSGVSSTDWSWSALWADYDNDGDKDMMVTNGFYRDLGNLDYIHYQARLQNPMGSRDAKREEKLKAINNLPKIPLQNYLFENDGNLRFKKQSDEWGFTDKGFSNGASYADLDNDGDLELIINEFNGEAKLYRNTANNLVKNNFLTVKLQGNTPNIQGIGSHVYLYTGGEKQLIEFNPYRGFESSVEPLIHFGLAKQAMVDSVIVVWPDGKRTMKQNIKSNQQILIKYNDAGQLKTDSITGGQNKLFTRLNDSSIIDYVHVENEYVDFKLQPLLPSMHSQNGPGIAVGDINGDGLEDFYAGAASGSNGMYFLQQENGSFKKKELPRTIAYEDMGVILFDADNDNDLDLYVVSGGSENLQNTPEQQDRLYINDSKGNFTYAPQLLPDTRASGSCVVAADYDKDGDLDLFVGGRVVPGSYPYSPQSYLLNNTQGKFTDVSDTQLPDKGKMGMVCSALWTDYNNDGWTDLMVAGEFMPLTIIPNQNGTMNFNAAIRVKDSGGWWNSIAAADFDEDGDIDYIAGNLGLNSRFRASPEKPLCIYAKDFDKNGRIDPVMCYYVNDKNYIYPTRDEMVKQINAMRGRFETYKSYADVTFEESFSPAELSDALVMKLECTESVYLENLGNGKFTKRALPIEAQFAPLYGMLTGDFNNDGHIDVIVAGNSYATESSTGRYDAMTGLLLTGDGKGNFHTNDAAQTGLLADKDVKALTELTGANGKSMLLVANNNARMECYNINSAYNQHEYAKQDEQYAIIQLNNGRSYRQEFYYGNNYLSQTSRKIAWSDSIQTVSFYNAQNKKRTVQ